MAKDFLKRPRKLASVAVADWDKTVFVPKISARELGDMGAAEDAIKAAHPGRPGEMRYLANVVASFACEEDGRKLFTKDDEPELLEQPFDALNAIAQALLDHNGLGAKTPHKSPAGPAPV